MSKRTVYEIKREIQNRNEQLRKLHNENIDRAMENDIESIERNNKEIKTIETSLIVLEEELNRREREIKKIPIGDDNPINNKAIFYRSILTRDPIPENVRRNLFGSNMTPSIGGDKFIPTTLAKELLHEPLDDNPLREIMKVTSIRGLETRKISYEIENLDFLKDGDTAKEINLTGDTISFGRFKFKIMSRVSDTVMYGTDTELVRYIEDSLKSGLATKEKYCIFKTTTPSEEHMNIYSTQNAIKEIEGETLFKAIKLALADLEDVYYKNATIVMHRTYYLKMLDELSNYNTNFYDKQPEQILGAKVVFCELAEKPIVGDFSQLHLNYDIDSVFESDKDIKSGENIFVLTAWADIRIKLKSAFRIATVTQNSGLSTRNRKVEDKVIS